MALQAELDPIHPAVERPLAVKARPASAEVRPVAAAAEALGPIRAPTRFRPPTRPPSADCPSRKRSGLPSATPGPALARSSSADGGGPKSPEGPSASGEAAAVAGRSNSEASCSSPLGALRVGRSALGEAEVVQAVAACTLMTGLPRDAVSERCRAGGSGEGEGAWKHRPRAAGVLRLMVRCGGFAASFALLTLPASKPC